MTGRSKMTEESILAFHRARAQAGFEALNEVTAFCCSGCGLCVSICPLESISFDDSSKKPVLTGGCNNCGYCYLACPRSFLPLSRIEEAFFGRGAGEEAERLGSCRDLFVARSLTEEIFREGTPGGTTTALVHYMMEKGHIDAALLTGSRHREVGYCMHPQPYIAASPGEVLQSAHSKFEISPVLAKLKDLGRFSRSLFVGTPCHITAFRKLQLISRDQLFRTAMGGLSARAEELTRGVRFALSINCFLNHTSMDRVYEWLQIREEDIVRFNENVSKDLLADAFNNGHDWRWFIQNCAVTRDGRVNRYDVLRMGELVLASGCLVCNDLITSKHADASIGFFGAETGIKEHGWNLVTVMHHEIKSIMDSMVAEQKLARKPVLRNYGRALRKAIEAVLRLIPGRDFMGAKSYLKTGKWSYPAFMKRMRGPRSGTYILGLELLFLAQTLREKMFYEGTVKSLKEAGAHLPEVY